MTSAVRTWRRACRQTGTITKFSCPFFPARALLLPIVTEDDIDEPAPPPLTTPPAMPRILYVRNFPVHTRARDLAYEFERYVNYILARR